MENTTFKEQLKLKTTVPLVKWVLSEETGKNAELVSEKQN